MKPEEKQAANDAVLIKVKVVQPEDLDPQILRDLGAQLITHIEPSDQDVSELVDEETLRDLDEDWGKATKQARFPDGST